MGFSVEIKQEIFVRSARHCCVCHERKGLNIEVHHIIPKHQGGKDTTENAIALCFDCHADAGHYFANHPKGSKLSPEELLKHKSEWFNIVSEHKINEPKNAFVELSVNNKNFDGKFQAAFIKETTTYLNRNDYKEIYELLGKDPMELVNEIKDKYKKLNYSDPYLNKVTNYDEFIDYLNGNHLKINTEKPDTNSQPVLHTIDAFRICKKINRSNCVLDLKFTNHGPEVLENYKLYLNFENIIEVDSVNKRSSISDMYKYKYNVKFFELNKGEFIPEKDVLVQNDSVLLDSICFRPDYKAKFINLNWELFARNIHNTGSLRFEIKSKFEKTNQQIFIENADKKKNTIRILPKIEFD